MHNWMCPQDVDDRLLVKVLALAARSNHLRKEDDMASDIIQGPANDTFKYGKRLAYRISDVEFAQCFAPAHDPSAFHDAGTRDFPARPRPSRMRHASCCYQRYPLRGAQTVPPPGITGAAVLLSVR